jgi:2-amino-4-hydroxy-6-hydroxymethyldihydropteridine diphosphokinase
LILISIGANLDSPAGPPRATCEAALVMLEEGGAVVLGRSRWFRSAPVPASSQPWFVNGVASLETGLDPAALLRLLLDTEAHFGRRRSQRWAARELDLDLLDYRGRLMAPGPPRLPHPRLHERLFVLAPLADVAPGWRHPADGRSIAEMLGALPPGQEVEPITGD